MDYAAVAQNRVFDQYCIDFILIGIKRLSSIYMKPPAGVSMKCGLVDYNVSWLVFAWRVEINRSIDVLGFFYS